MASQLTYCLILLSVLAHGVKPWAINLFSGKDYRDLPIGIAGQEEECVNIPNFFHTQSIDPRDFCVNLYDRPDCEGTKFAFFKASLHNNNLELISKTRLASAKSCNTDY